MSSRNDFPITVPALKITQPLGVFYVTKLSAQLLLDVTYSDPLRATGEANETLLYPLRGSQREEKEIRLREIGRFIETAEAAFPNSIILAANYKEDGSLEENPKRHWRVNESPDSNDCVRLIIPTPDKLASIIDGQHRLHGFEKAARERRDMELLCAVYLDLPYPYQAYIFATINFNQKKVDKSLAYQLFAINLDEEPPESWAPEKTAVFLSRKLNVEEDSPFYQRIIVAAQDEFVLFVNRPKNVDWVVSTATVVEGILRLFSSNPKKDRDIMHKQTIEGGRLRSVLGDDRTPLRKYFLETNDIVIYTAVKNFFLAVKEVFWSSASESSYITKTVGIQALFDVLKLLLIKHLEEKKNLKVEYFINHLRLASQIDFSTPEFQASGIGKSRIRQAISEAIGLEE